MLIFRFRLSLVTLVLLAALEATAAPLPALWPLALAQETGWRFRREFVTWPGEYWRGADQPPQAPLADCPVTWGTLRLAGVFTEPPAPEYAATDLLAPLTETRPVIDGQIGFDEWGGAGQAIELLEEGEEWVLLAQRTSDTLYVCLAAPSLLAMREGQVAEVSLAPAGSGEAPIGPGTRQFRIKAEREGKSARQSFSGERGAWARLAASEAETWRGAAAGTGDGAWSFVVYEFALPYRELGVGDCPPEQMRFLARLQNLSQRAQVGAGRSVCPETIAWPDRRSSYGLTSAPTAGLRPDHWGHVVICAEDLQPGLRVPLLTQPVRVDGQIGLKEWADAAAATYHLPGDQWRKVWLGRDAKCLYVAVRVRLARGSRRDETCHIYVDPCGDGGLLPRGDDLQYRIPLGLETISETLRFGKDAWQFCAYKEIPAASYPLSPYESCYEAALPLTALGPTGPNLAVEVSYGLGK